MFLALLFGVALAADPATDPAAAPEPAPAPTTEPAPAPAEPAPAPAAEPKAPPKIEAAPGKGVTVTTADQRFSMKLGARLQLRETLDVSSPDAALDRHTTLLTQIRTARIGVSGFVLNEDTKYNLLLAFGEGDFRDTARSPVLDAWVDLTYVRDASVKMGQMFVPFDRSRTTRDALLQLPNRPLVVNEFTLDRGVGAYVYSDRFLGDASPIGFKAGVFGANGLHLTTFQAPGAIFVGRVEYRPLGPIDDDSDGDQQRRKKPGLAIGAAAAYSLDTSRVRSTQGLFYLDDTVDYFHFTGDVVFKWLGFAFMGEVIGREADVDGVVDDADPPVIRYTRSGWGWVAQPSYAFTTRYELVARYAEAIPFAGTDPDFEHQHEVAGGFNIYLNGHAFKIQLDWQAIWSDDFGAAEHQAHAVLDVSM